MEKPTLTPQQREVVENRGGSLLVSAAAGSGKTKVLVERLFRFVTEEHCNVDDFLIITYTKAAAAELRGKIAAELSRRMGETPGDQHLKRQLLRVYQADIKTVDAFCTALLRENTHLLAREEDRCALTPDFKVLDDSEARLVRVRVLGRALESFYDALDALREQLADTLGAGRDDSALEELVLEVYEKLQSHAYPDRWLAESRSAWSGLDGSFEDTPYAAELLRSIRRKADYWAALLEKTAEGMAEDAALAAGYGEKFQIAAGGFQTLSQSGDWETARRCGQMVDFPRLNTPRGRKDDPCVAAAKQVWEACKAEKKKLDRLLDVSGEEAMEDLRAVAPAMEALLELTVTFSESYRVEKLRMNALDFSDQEHLALRLLVAEDGAPTELGEQVAARYQEILVDEYQDTNEVQNAIFRAVSKREQNLFTVGDVKQSIYRFRLADPTIFLGKYNRFKSWEEVQPGEERKILLSKNFRSRQEVLDAANFIFTNILSPEMGEMTYGEEEALHFGAAYYPPRDDCATEFHLIAARQKSAENDQPVKKLTAEARFVAKRIRQLLDEGYGVTDGDGQLRPCRPEDVVILMRSPGSRTAAYAQALAERDIPCSFEESGDFFHTMEISVMLALLELLDNPRQDVPLISVLRSPLFGFSPDRLAEIRAKAPGGDYFDAVSADGGADCAAFLETLSALRASARDMNVHRLVWHLYNTLNVLGIFGAMDAGAERRENLIAFSRHAEKFESGGYRGLFAFVTQLRRLLDADQAPSTKAAAAVNGVRLMSIHKSKGLEFPIVILADLDHAFSRQDFDTPVLVHPEMGLGPRRVDLERKIQYPTLARLAIEEKLRRENLSEEQRILYVAMTRPKEKLILVDAMYHAEGRLQKLAAVAACPVEPETVAAGKTFGDWLLLPLLCRPEALPLRTLADLPVETAQTLDTSAWQVFTHDSEDYRERPACAKILSPEAEGEVSFDEELLSFVYPYQRETLLPAKVTATQLKGRTLDEEIAENAARTPYVRPLSQPKFRQEHYGLTPAERGTATHLVLQYLDFDEGNVAGQVERLQARDLLTPRQASAVDVGALERFLASPLAEEIRRGSHLLREYRFTLLMDDRLYDPEAAGEDAILLQGVVDCCFETPEGVTVVDFKTDQVRTEEEVARRAAHYRAQLEAYSMALERVLERPVKRRALYFLAAGACVDV
ncbi:helicase-exonuclease AddAB subunit AddA [Oscillibacter sp.]|uniref:helicase-exonuclease AddAB subunit AddA n=1 Tax=Oscillibacter sp. TaxID=1945593 RepID=UPI0026317E2F|nr:helicase-exonuclease AddAB subunit AddA [Oscillibacter sp.]MDD3346855.1 helicase-exonuclease AddAB subunit AddA [Oscillibacter sp.]